MSNFPVDVKILPYPGHYGGRRKKPVRKIAIHHAAGVMTAKALGDFFAGGSRYASSNYGIGYDGSVGLYVPEENLAYTTGHAVDEEAITVEVSNSRAGGDWPISQKSMEKLIELCVYICKKYGIKDCSYTGDKNGVLQMHKWYASTSCPGPYLSAKFPYISQEVNRRLKGSAPTPKPTPTPGETLWRVQVGAYKNPDNAVAMEKKLKAKGYDTYVVTMDGLIKVQVGAYSIKANALAMEAKLKADGFETYLTTKGGSKYTPQKPQIKVGSIVRVRKGATDYSGTQLYDFVYDRDHKVKEISGDRAVITYGGAVVAAVHIDNLVLV